MVAVEGGGGEEKKVEGTQKERREGRKEVGSQSGNQHPFLEGARQVLEVEGKMHDFCFTVPYGLILLGGGIVGYVKKGSMASLGGGAGTGVLLIFAGYLSLKAFERRKNSHVAFFIETVCAAVLTFIMGQRYMLTAKFMPTGVLAGISAFMTGFYLYKIATGGNQIPTKAE